jgi:hypothetical protein
VHSPFLTFSKPVDFLERVELLQSPRAVQLALVVRPLLRHVANCLRFLELLPRKLVQPGQFLLELRVLSFVYVILAQAVSAESEID